MLNNRLKTGVFVVEGLNSLAITFYFYYFYFFMHERFGFGDKANLLLAALNGLVYAVAVFWTGRFAQRAGYFTALKIGFALMFTALAVGTQVESALGHVVVMLVADVGMSFTWPCLEAVVSEGEPPQRLQRMIGIYNVVWAGLGALAYFLGGVMLEKLGLKSILFVPMTLLAIQLGITVWLERKAKAQALKTATYDTPVASAINGHAQLNGNGGGLTPRPIARTRLFLRMAWLVNPLSYIAINTLVAVMPGVANRLGLSTALAGFCCSVWCFARLGAFVGLWIWPGWHYRFRWLITAYLLMLTSFAVILLVPSLPLFVGAQIAFGLGLGLIYYSSLFYSMDVGDTKGEHGGIHEATMGLGNFAGPAVGAAALHFLPQSPHSGALAVGVVLLGGLAGLLGVWVKNKT